MSTSRKHKQALRAGAKLPALPAEAKAEPRKPVVIPQSAKVITARQVRELLGGVSEMYLWRLVNERASLKFPRPFKINARNFFNRKQVEAWIDAQQAAGVSKAA